MLVALTPHSQMYLKNLVLKQTHFCLKRVLCNVLFLYVQHTGTSKTYEYTSYRHTHGQIHFNPISHIKISHMCEEIYACFNKVHLIYV